MNSSRSVRMRRHSLAAAISLALASTTAQADTFNVTTNADAGAGSFRAAITSANGTAGPHTIDFSAISGQTITLESNLPRIEEDLTLQGSDVTLGGDDQYRCLYAYFADLEVADMTVTGCIGTNVTGAQLAFEEQRGISGSTRYAGGGALVKYGDLTLSNATITDNHLPYEAEYIYGYGGGVAVMSGSLTSSNNTTISANSAYVGGGVYLAGAVANFADTTISDNTANKYGGGIVSFGGSPSIESQPEERGVPIMVTLNTSSVSGNSAEVAGGAFVIGDMEMTESQISGNQAAVGGGLFRLPTKYGAGLFVTDSKISDNTADEVYGGLISVGSTSMVGTTISGNEAGYAIGGAILAAQYETDQIVLTNSTISGNTAGEAAGLVLVGDYNSGEYSGLSLTGVTITGNEATSYSGGGLVGLPDYAPIPFFIDNSIISGNSTVSGSADMSAGVFGAVRSASEERAGAMAPLREFLGFGSRGGNDPANVVFEVNYSLIGESPDAGTFNPDTVTGNLLGTPEQLAALADNGGPTMTHLPDAASPAVDAIPSGTNGCGGAFDVDQRGEPRPEGDGCEMGSVERGAEPPPPPPPEPMMVPVLDRIGLLVLAFGAGLLGLLGLHRRRQRH